jgi:hypothetical protein
LAAQERSPATGSSAGAHHLALTLLAGRLRKIGFEVRKKPDREETLRV